MKKILTALFCLAGIASAQTYQPAPDAKWVQKVIDVKYANTNALAQLLSGMQQTRTGDRVTAQLDLHAISVGSYDPAFLKLAEEIIQRYDVPNAAPAVASHQYGVEIVAHILLAGPKGSSGDALPAELAPVATQLRSTCVRGTTPQSARGPPLRRGKANRPGRNAATPPACAP